MYIDNDDFAQSLERDARMFAARNGDHEDRGSIIWIVADLEFLYDRDRFAAFAAVHGHEPKRGIRWPFHDLAAISWLSFQLQPGHDVPEVSAPTVMTANEHGQKDMLTSFFAELTGAGPSRLVTWGGEARDYAVLRHLACRHNLVLPAQLRNTSPYAPERLDLCRAVTVQADPVHLQEYAGGSGVPAKPSEPNQIGAIAERGEWPLVHDHVLADVATTSIVALRHLAANAEIACDRERSAQAVANAIGTAFPNSVFWKRELRPWARDQLRAAGLRGTIYRAPVAA